MLQNWFQPLFLLHFLTSMVLDHWGSTFHCYNCHLQMWCCQNELFYTSTKSLRGSFFFTSVYLCVCVSVCLSVCLSVCEQIPIKPLHWFWRSLRLIVANCSSSNPIEIGDLGSKVKVTVTLHPFFLHNSLLISLLWILALLSPIKMKFSLSLRYALDR